jgi:hypothetical protein
MRVGAWECCLRLTTGQREPVLKPQRTCLGLVENKERPNSLTQQRLEPGLSEMPVVGERSRESLLFHD